MGPLGAPSAGSTLSPASEGAAGPVHRQVEKGSTDSLTQWVEQNQVCTSGSWDSPCSPPSSPERHHLLVLPPPPPCSFPFPVLSPLPTSLPPSPRLAGRSVLFLFIVSCSSFLSLALSGEQVHASVCPWSSERDNVGLHRGLAG